MIRYKAIEQPLRDAFIAQLDSYHQWKDNQEENSRQYEIVELSKDKLHVNAGDASINSSLFALGQNKSATEDFIMKRYQLKDGKVSHKSSVEAPKVIVLI
jgi:hypothetical protein